LRWLVLSRVEEIEWSKIRNKRVSKRGPTMSMVAFMPWFQTRTPVRIGKFKFSPFPGKPFKGEPAKALREILACHQSSAGAKRKGATVVTMAGKAFGEDFSDEEKSELFLAADLLAYSYVFERGYFGDALYCNKDDFECGIQRYDRKFEGAALVARRRDGRTLSFVYARDYKVVRPNHVGHDFIGKPNRNLLKSLTKVRESQQWAKVGPSMDAFCRANTDSSSVSPRTELVDLMSAFERLLDISNSNAAETARRLEALMRANHFPKVLPWGRAVLDKDIAKGRRTILEAWIHDLHKTRGFFAHGHHEVPAKVMWQLDEHLLLGSYFYPLVLKMWLKKHSFYRLTAKDRSDIEVFESLACIPNLFGEVEPGHYQWSKVRVDHWWDKKVEGIVNSVSREAKTEEKSKSRAMKAQIPVGSKPY